MAEIAVYPTSSLALQKAERLSFLLGLPCVLKPSCEFDFLLCVDLHGLSLKALHSKALPVAVDFLSKRMQYRMRHLSLKNELLARALGLRKNISPSIVDATGGLAQDSFILAALGYKVTVLERSPIIYYLVEDGLNRASSHIQCIENIKLIHADAISWLKTSGKIDIIYLDPMFPESKKRRALTNKAMAFFKCLLPRDDDDEDLLSVALSCATKRVVVKRPRHAQCIKNTVFPHHALKGTSCRFDVYLK